MYLSMIIPAYNEAARIGRTLEQFTAYLSTRPWSWEIIVVDDGSDDDTAGVVASFARQRDSRVRLARLEQNQGKGAAVRHGMLWEAGGTLRFFSDADGSTPITCLERFLPLLENGVDIVIGSRAHPESVIEVRQQCYREFMGRTYNLMARGLGLTRFRDTQCGFKGFTRKAAEICFSRQRLTDFAFDCEVLYIAAFHGLEVREVPIRWINSPKSRVRPVRDSARMAAGLLRIRLNGLLGYYR
ncbi:MAG TPA: glycosyltransferase family 2 protein [Candidatus Hydrogenedentes bacterium]|nr:glycosyltransferase family 2 protein [Candidatus Hydrogenedentota bacterium]